VERGIQSKGERVLNARLHLSADADDTDLTRREPRATETLTLAAHNTGGTHHAALFSLPITSDSPKAEDTGKMHTGGKHLEKRGGVAGNSPRARAGIVATAHTPAPGPAGRRHHPSLRSAKA